MFSQSRIKNLTGLKDVTVLAEIDSTNTFLKKQVNNREEGALVIAKEQTAGRGRLGRTFVSQRNGLYMSLLLKPDFFDILKITTMAAVAVARATDKHRESKIKWVNDIYIADKKVAGILTEGVFEGSILKGAVLGIGVNLIKPENGIDESIKDIADYIFEEDTGIADEFVADIINNFFDIYKGKEYIEEYRDKSYLTGKKVFFEKDNKEYSGVVTGIDDDCGLIVDCNSEKITLKCGEVTVRGFR